jgi:hypothetical protein
MKRLFRNATKKLMGNFLIPVKQKLEMHKIMMRYLADANFRTRTKLRRTQNQPIHIVFVCHMPALWGMFDSVYKAVSKAPDFTVTVVALPYRHNTLPEGQYKDEGVFEYLSGMSVNVIRGYDKDNDEWLDPAELSPDYVFFQTPYRNFPDEWSIDYLSLISKICYVPYGGCIYAGDVDEIVNPESFFSHASIVFKEDTYSKNKFEQRFGDKPWFNDVSIFISGCPKLDFLVEDNSYTGMFWRHGLQKGVKKILWTPRWHTSEGNCHFFEYKQFFIDYCTCHQNVDFIFRPHPLSLQNFLKTGELSSSDLQAMESAYKISSNMAIEINCGYEDSFVTSDFLVSDMSTILFEYFATGKPIIYTHRVDHFNELGKKLSEGFYWVTNSTELHNMLDLLLSGDDPLKTKREEIRESLMYVPDNGSGQFIRNVIKRDYISI